MEGRAWRLVAGSGEERYRQRVPPHLAYQRPGLERLFRGLKAPADLILKRVSRLDAFSGYLFHT